MRTNVVDQFAEATCLSVTNFIEGQLELKSISTGVFRVLRGPVTETPDELSGMARKT